jgi:hypothetical protein
MIFTCFVCGASSADQLMDVVNDGDQDYACHDIQACLDRARANAARSI